MKMNDITVEVKAKLDVNKSTAEACLKLVEVYLQEHPNVDILCTTSGCGDRCLGFVEYEEKEK